MHVDVGALLDDRVEAERAIRDLPHEPQAVAQIVAVHEAHRDRLHDPEASRGAHRGDELGVRARVHGPANQRNLDTGVTREGGLEGAHGARSSTDRAPCRTASSRASSRAW
jgi:hypothetical protein